MPLLPVFYGFGALGLLVLAFGLFVLVLHWPKGVHYTFSQHAATNRTTIMYYIGLFAVSLILINLFFWLWFVPSFDVHWAFLAFVTAASLLQVAVTFIPETKGKQARTHRLLAGVSALLLLPAMYVLTMSESIPYEQRIWVAGALMGMLILATVVIYYRGLPKYFLLLQAAYFALFFAPIMMISYT